MSKPLVEVLSFDGCPHTESALELVRRVIAESGVGATVRCVDVPDAQAAEAQRFLGSPTIRVNGRDIEPGADRRTEFSYSCRTYPAPQGRSGMPDEAWVRAALRRAS